MASIAKTAPEILLEQISDTVKSLTSEKKAKEVAISELNNQLVEAERALPGRLAVLQEQFDVKKAELAVAIAPLEDLKASCQALKKDVEHLKQAKLDAVAEIKAAKGTVLQVLEAKVAKENARLAKIEEAIAACKKVVAGL